MSSTNTSSPSSRPPLGIDEILNLYLMPFEAAVQAYRPESVIFFNPSPFNRDVLEVYIHADKSRREELPRGTTVRMEESYRHWNLCDHFCVLLYEMLKKRLEPFGATVTWAVVTAQPKIILVHGHQQPERLQALLDSIAHSVLFVKTKDGRIIILDGTIKQFGWEGSSRILSEDAFWGEHAVKKKNWYNGAESLKFILKMICEQDDGYWGRVFRSLWEMFENLDWEEMEKMSPVGRSALVRTEAENRAGVAALATWG